MAIPTFDPPNMKCFTPKQLAALARQYGGPLWVYHADTIRQRIAELKCFDVIRYAQKANSTPTSCG